MLTRTSLTYTRCLTKSMKTKPTSRTYTNSLKCSLWIAIVAKSLNPSENLAQLQLTIPTDFKCVSLQYTGLCNAPSPPYYVQRFVVSVTTCCWQNIRERVVCTTRCVANSIGRTWRMTSTKLSWTVVLMYKTAKLTANNVNSACFQTIRICGHELTRSVTEDEIWKLVHRGDDGPVFKANQGNTDCSNNCRCSRNYICRTLDIKLWFPGNSTNR